MTEQKTALDFEALRRASEQNDAEALVGLFADDAEVRLISKDKPASTWTGLKSWRRQRSRWRAAGSRARSP